MQTWVVCQRFLLPVQGVQKKVTYIANPKFGIIFFGDIPQDHYIFGLFDPPNGWFTDACANALGKCLFINDISWTCPFATPWRCIHPNTLRCYPIRIVLFEHQNSWRPQNQANIWWLPNCWITTIISRTTYMKIKHKKTLTLLSFPIFFRLLPFTSSNCHDDRSQEHRRHGRQLATYCGRHLNRWVPGHGGVLNLGHLITEIVG